MDTTLFWNEELASFPHGGQGSAVWVVRREGSEVSSPLRVLFSWASGRARQEGLAQQPPLGGLLKAMQSQREELVTRPGGAALWLEPLISQGQVKGCLGIWFDLSEPWREGIFLWGQRLSARVGPLLEQLEPMPAMIGIGGTVNQPSLFPLPQLAMLAEAGARVHVRSEEKSSALDHLPLPRPVSIPGIPGCIGVSLEMRRLGERLGPIARSGVNVLLHGESGVGKEIIARGLHLCSPRREGAFIGQNCAALPESLFESELFGHKAGAFTGAMGDKQGLLAAASGGTFFLDEIGDMPLALQIKLLRVMQEHRVRRIGELNSRKVDLRFVAASHKDLEREIQAGRFRLDLFYRLKVVSLVIPPLRHRPEDIAPLFSFFLRKAKRPIAQMTISEKALQVLQRWPWPGNVRELENEVARFLALYPRQMHIRRRHLSPDIQSGHPEVDSATELMTVRNLNQAGEMLEQFLIRKAIAATDGRKAAAARRLGLSRQGLYKKIQRYGMQDLVETRPRQEVLEPSPD
jgi:transcriptional regulator with AAA-type ATPase domain